MLAQLEEQELRQRKTAATSAGAGAEATGEAEEDDEEESKPSAAQVTGMQFKLLHLILIAIIGILIGKFVL